MKLQAVIGAQFGDEGKGLITDYLATDKSLVVRYNGGAQAGHTVQLPSGRSHEFHHLGSGTFKRATTLLSRFFIVNPILFSQELAELGDPGGLRVAVDPRCPVTTPFDMLLNRVLEDSRGSQRHGSCGLGINETMTRHLEGPAVIAASLWLPEILKKQLWRIEHEWLPYRAAALGIDMPRIKPHIKEDFLECVARFLERTVITTDASLISSRREDVIFEGAQGLRLDEKNGLFPHVTRSRTGLTNIETLLTDAGLRDELLEVYYVTRCYTTRHGNGPLTDELPGHPYGWTGPETNTTNEYQGSFRYAPLNCAKLKRAIDVDLNVDLTAMPRWALTCLDQMPEDGRQILIRNLELETERRVALVSVGPTRDDVSRLIRPFMEEVTL